MKKIVFTVVILGFILAMSSCDYDDSNDIDLIIPNDDTTETSTTNELNLKNPQSND